MVEMCTRYDVCVLKRVNEFTLEDTAGEEVPERVSHRAENRRAN